MFYSSYNYILPSEQKDEQILRTSYSQLLKTPYKAPHNTATQDMSNTILYALEKNVYDMSEISNMLQSLLSSLCTDTNSDFFGLFPYFLSMTPDDYIKPDYSFQPLVLLPLLECYIDFSHRFSPELMLRLSEVLTMSTNILSYTSNYIDSHTKLLEIILMVCVGEHFSIPQFIRSAKNKTTKYYHFIKYNGDMPLEYNSPEHIVLQLEAILHFSSYITDEDLKRILNEIKDILLSIFYRHFNPFLLQWTGPFSIKHSTFIKDDFLETIKNVIKQDDLEQLTVPKKFYNISLSRKKRFERLLVSRGLLFPDYKHYLVASLYNSKSFSLSSFNHDDLWNRRMPCTGYFGDAKNPYCLYIQCLLNNICFSSGSFHSVQHKEVLLGHINFSTNRGYKNIAIDNKESYKTNDLRIRFCIEGDISKLKVVQEDNAIKVQYKKICVLFNYLYAVLDDNNIKYEFTASDTALYFDVILYSGKEIDLKLKELNEAITAFSLYMGEKNILKCESSTYHDEKYLYSKACVSDVEIMLKSHRKPDSYEAIFSQDAQYISNIDIGTYIDKEETFTKHHDFFFENNNTQSYFLKKNNFYNKKILRKISNISTSSLNDICPEINKLFNSLDDFSDNETKHYSVLILHQLYALAMQTDRRFIKLIERNYSDVYQLVRTSTSKKQIKKIISNTARQLHSDYKELKFQNLSQTNAIIEEIIKTIHSEFDDPNLSLQNLSVKHGASTSYISRKFSEYIGISYAKYITQLRVNKAVEILNSNPDTPNIHLQCGYYNMQTFTSAFKKITGFSVKSFIERQKTNT